MSAEQARAISSVPTGNTYDKYGSSNPVVRRLMAGFQRTLAELFERAEPDSVLDVGCGEGVLTFEWAKQLGSRPVVGVDLPDPKLETEWRTRGRPNLSCGMPSGTAACSFRARWKHSPRTARACTPGRRRPCARPWRWLTNWG